ncbi:uncharacterized protein BDR25DRAFT_63113 [Lindgomyces ingoldianus]|uniref:Uncharacterized protein n=1 Tax=Lindgomyces ingoldianus TaxID=673940 RepID=A0ACB6QKG9_9PLEO|nr:uncharacterized protein BDR25DRAFT_63113 [Lindgomyces ingoldianus]KAF2467509.1 hypothetical protein BDR25DRAFT_63113 [Lindgomyces ingoldianus]
MASYSTCLSNDSWTVDDVELQKDSNRKPHPTADRLLLFREPLRWFLLLVFFYSVAILGTVWWAYSGPTHHTWSQRVLPTGNVKVDQFYSGVASVAFMVPAAALISQICLEFGLLHPFSIAHRLPVSAADLDKMIDVGPWSLLTVWKYSRWRALMLGMLMAIGSAIVPVSSLILTTGTHVPQTRHTGVVGLPVHPSNILLDMSASMGYSGTGPFEPGFKSDDLVLNMMADTYKGYVVSRKMLLNMTSNQLGPIPTINMTFTPGVRYDGVVSFLWDSHCEPADDDIKYDISEENGKPRVTFTWPDGTKNETGSWSKSGDTTIYMWSDAPKTSSGIPRGGTTYVAQASLLKHYNPTESLEVEGITATKYGTWISRVKCRPTMKWQVSSCLATGDGMENCTETPGANTTVLDTIALDALSGYMTAIPWLLYLRDDYSFRMTLEPFFIMPTVAHYERILGVLAQSITAITTGGYFGTATVPALGEEPRPVYIVRVYVLFILLGLLYLALALSGSDLLYSKLNRLPFRKATFLTIAYAVHGRGVDWDESCGCVKSREDLRKSNNVMLRYGIDIEDRFHVGLAGEVRAWEPGVFDDGGDGDPERRSGDGRMSYASDE